MKLTKFDKLLDAVQSNAYPAMIADVAEHLGVSDDSLRRLGIGYHPAVPFKKGINYSGWWCLPERDADAKLTGLSLRSRDDMKVMYPGSQHGLIYEVNLNHRSGNRHYDAGPSNWVRTMDAGILCPICGKPDGCLLSSDNPSDPQAVVCLRSEAGSVRPLRLGFLHIRKSSDVLQHASALADGDPNLPVIVVEGASDTAAAMDLGFVAVGRPSNLACMDMLRDLCRGRKVLIVGENDKKSTGKWPGYEGMLASYQTLKGACKDPQMVLPPEHIKDLRAWRVNFGLTKEGLLEYAAKTPVKWDESNILKSDNPYVIAEAFLQQNFKLASHYTLRRWEEDWYRFVGHKYRKCSKEELYPTLQKWANEKQVETDSDKKPLVPLEVRLFDIQEHLIAQVLVEDKAMPCWTNGASGPEPRDLISFSNGILNVVDYFNGDADAFSEPTPDLFTVHSLPTAFDPTATCPAWLSFLESSLGDEPAKIDLLQEWIGYQLTPDTNYQKMMFLRGPTAAGKSRVLEVIQNVLGKEQIAAPVFNDLANFGLNALIGKLAVLIGDARTPKKSADETGLETLLRITGNDALMINRKNRDHLEAVHLTARITMASNGFLDVSDHYGAMLRRLLIIQFNRSFKGREDYQLPKKLAAETQGITNWALEGLRRLRTNETFTTPASMNEAMEEWRRGASPLASFLIECCDELPTLSVGKRELFDAWSAWAGDHRVFLPNFQRFMEWLRSNTSAVTVEAERFVGIGLKEWAAKKYLGRSQ